MHNPVSSKCLIAFSLVAAAAGGSAIAQTQLPEYEAVKTTLWALEQSTFAAREQGNRAAERATQSPYFRRFPIGWGRAPIPEQLKGGEERLDLTFVNLAYNGGTAVVMFKAHRTMKPDGTPANAYFEVTDIWSKADGKWRLLASNPQPVQPPGQ